MKRIYIPLFAAAGFLFMPGCTKDDFKPKNPYESDKVPLGITFSKELVTPEEGAPLGGEVTLSGSGFLKYKDSLTVKFNGEKAEILNLTDEAIKVKVPAWASTGIISLVINGEVLLGPDYQIQGLLQQESSFNAKIGSNGVIGDVLQLSDGKFIFTGSFSDYGNSFSKDGINNIVCVEPDGNRDRSFRSGRGATGAIYSIRQQQQGTNRGKLIIAGDVTSYARIGTEKRNSPVNRITRLNENGSLDTLRIQTYTNRDTILPAFAGGVDGGVAKIKILPDDKIIVAGTFRYYLRNIYDRPSSTLQDTVVTDSIRIPTIVRLLPDGNIDSSFNYLPGQKKGKEGANGPIFDMHVQADGKIILVGEFTKFNGTGANRIVRLLPDGTVDGSFNVGAGADGTIATICATTSGKFILGGFFSNFNGTAAPRIAAVDGTGKVDAGFKIDGTGPESVVSNITELANGVLAVSGSYSRFNGLNRKGLVFLKSNGSLHEQLNTVSGTNGSIIGFFPVGNSFFAAGGFTKFDRIPCGGIIRLKY